MNTPCRYCEKRTPSCHSTCKDYARYSELIAERRKKRRMDGILSDNSPSKAARIRKVRINEMRKGTTKI